MMEYSDKVMEHFMNPKNVGEIENASGIGTVGNAKCGDIMKVYITELNMFEKILSVIFKKYTYKIYRKGVKDGYNWKE